MHIHVRAAAADLRCLIQRPEAVTAEQEVYGGVRQHPVHRCLPAACGALVVLNSQLRLQAQDVANAIPGKEALGALQEPHGPLVACNES